MIIYNVTINIDLDVHDQWLTWMKEIHIPEVMQTGLFLESKMLKVLVEEQQGITYSIQYTAANMKDYEEYKAKHAPSLQKKINEKFANKFVAFRTLLETV